MIIPLLASLVLAQEPAPPPPPATTAPAAPPEAGTDADGAAIAEGVKLLDVGPDTAANYQAALALFAKVQPPSPRAARARAYEAEAWLRIGDLESDKKKKLPLYEKGKAAALAAIALDAKCADCWFWKGATEGRWGETRGIMESIFIVKPVREAFTKTLQLDPGNLDAMLALALVDQKVPGFMGGDKERAEKAFRAVLAKSPHHVRAMLDWAEFLWEDGQKDEARKWAQKALDEKAPVSPGDKRKFDDKRARKLLAEWR